MLTSQPKDIKIFFASLIEIGIPMTLLNLSIFNSIFFFFFGKFPVIKNLLASPPQISRINFVAFSSPGFIDKGSMPLSNLCFASVSMLKFFEVFLIKEE